MSIEEAIKHCNEVADSYNDTVPDCDCASDHRQLANWLQELKERREKERREKERREKEQRGVNICKPYLTIQVDTEMMHRVINEAIDNMYFECKNCGQKMFPQRKEESE